MYKIIASFKCGCFSKSSFAEETVFDSKEEALQTAKQMLDFMKNEFCGKHTFSMSEHGNNFIIDAQINSQK